IKSFASGVYSVPAGGGQPKAVTQNGFAPDDRAHLWPDALPGGKAIIFTVWSGRSFNDARIEALSLDSGKRKVLIEAGTSGRYIPGGYIAYVRNGNLFVAGFDPKRLVVEGTPVLVTEGVMSGASNGDGVFDVSSNGTLTYEPGKFTSFERNLVW